MIKNKFSFILGMILLLLAIYQIIDVLFISSFEVKTLIGGIAFFILGLFHSLRSVGKILEHW